MFARSAVSDSVPCYKRNMKQFGPEPPKTTVRLIFSLIQDKESML